MIGVKKIKKGQIETYTTADIADSVNKRYQTDNQQTYNDATSSIQTQLNTKQTYLVKDSSVTSSVTGTTSVTQIGASILIPANTFNANDVIVLDSFAVGRLANTGNNISCRLYHNTTNTLSGASLLCTGLFTGLSMNQRRIFEIIDGLLKCRFSPSTGSFTDYASSTNASLSISFNPAIDNYFFRTVQLSVSTDSAFGTQIIILK